MYLRWGGDELILSPTSNDCCLYKRETRMHRDTGKELCEEGGGDRRGAATSRERLEPEDAGKTLP